ncbi:GSCOCG00012646001-RA-CDS, partial [Cotesia congregata]
MKNNKIPSLSMYYEELQFPKVPDEVLKLTDLEERFICPRIPFMTIRATINDGQYFVKGRAVNVPTN